MSVARVALGALFGALALPLACGERAGDPVVWLMPPGDGTGSTSGAGGTSARAGSGTGASSPIEPTPGDTGGATNDGTSDSNDGGAAPVPQPEVGAVGLCGDCTEGGDCGSTNDVCIHHDGQRFCGRYCDDQRRCPNGYSCAQLENSSLLQCVPQNECPTPSAPVPELADLRATILARVNNERAMRDLAPLQASACLDTLAQSSALAFARSDEPLIKFRNECDPVWPNCACGWTGEAEFTMARYALDWSTTVDVAFTVRDDQMTRFTRAFLEFNVTDVGIGFWLSGDEAWIALSFH